MVGTFRYICDNCGTIFERSCSIINRDDIVGNLCPNCKEGYIKRLYSEPNITFDMLKEKPSDLKLVINKLKDRAKLDSIVEEDIND